MQFKAEKNEIRRFCFQLLFFHKRLIRFVNGLKLTVFADR